MKARKRESEKEARKTYLRVVCQGAAVVVVMKHSHGWVGWWAVRRQGRHDEHGHDRREASRPFRADHSELVSVEVPCKDAFDRAIVPVVEYGQCQS